MTATDKLRRLLDERGVEHFDGTETTLWGYEPTGESMGAYRFAADETSGGRMQVRMFHLTPEQAVEATLGSDLKAENEKLRELVHISIEFCANGMCGIYDGCPLNAADGRCRFDDRARELGVEV